MIGFAIIMGLIINLVSDNGGMRSKVLHHLTDNPLAIKQVTGIGDIHILPDSISLLRTIGPHSQNLRISFRQPGGNRISGRTQNHLNTGSVHLIENPVHPGKLEIALLRLEQRPGRFTHPNHIHPRLLHQPDILIEPLRRHILMIIGRPVQHRIEPILRTRLKRTPQQHQENPNLLHTLKYYFAREARITSPPT